MARTKTYYYLVDKLNDQSAPKIRSALKALESVEDVRPRLASGIIEVDAKKDVEQELKMAAEIAGCIFRTKVQKKQVR
ncbi:MAG: hypothetical protein JW760_12750 [Spirochaetales bacterium]|nr:hypothetical protein [Spirochaetales bacterium]